MFSFAHRSFSLALTAVALSVLISIYSYKNIRHAFCLKSSIVANPQESCKFGENNQKLSGKEIVWIGENATDKLLGNSRFPIPPFLSKTEFIEWLRYASRRKMKSDKEFISRIILRNIRKKYKGKLTEVEGDEHQAKINFEFSDNGKEIKNIEHTLKSSLQALLNMKKFINHNTISERKHSTDNNLSSQNNIDITQINNISISKDIIINDKSKVEVEVEADDIQIHKSDASQQLQMRIHRIQQLLPLKEIEVKSLAQKLDILKHTTPEYEALIQAAQQVKECHEDIGLTAANTSLQLSQQDSGRGRNRRGVRFEDAANTVITTHLLPLIAVKENVPVSDLIVVRNVKLGMASQRGTTAEIDSLVCMCAPRPASLAGHRIARSGEFCRVLAVIEVKVKADDIGEAFCSYQQSLAWLCGLEHMYDPILWKTKAYPKGHFDRPFLHWSHGQRQNLLFTRESFEEIKEHAVTISKNFMEINNINNNQNNLLFLEKFYFVTKDCQLESMSSKTMNWVMHQVASGEHFDDELSDACADDIETLRLSAIDKFPFRMSTIEVLKLYRSLKFDDHIVVVGVDTNCLSAVEEVIQKV